MATQVEMNCETLEEAVEGLFMLGSCVGEGGWLLSRGGATRMEQMSTVCQAETDNYIPAERSSTLGNNTPA